MINLLLAIYLTYGLLTEELSFFQTTVILLLGFIYIQKYDKNQYRN